MSGVETPRLTEEAISKIKAMALRPGDFLRTNTHLVLTCGELLSLISEVERLRTLCNRAADKLDDHQDEGPATADGWQSKDLPGAHQRAERRIVSHTMKQIDEALERQCGSPACHVLSLVIAEKLREAVRIGFDCGYSAYGWGVGREGPQRDEALRIAIESVITRQKPRDVLSTS